MAGAIAAAWPRFVRQGGGCIVNVSSMSSLDPFPGLSVYGAAKAALNAIVKGCVHEGAAAGIRAFTVAPGSVETAMLRAIAREMGMTAPEPQAVEYIYFVAGGSDSPH